MKRAHVVILALSVACQLGCPGGDKPTLHGPDPTAADAIAQLTRARALVTSFRADSTMDYRFNNQRVKGGVFVMGQPGAKVRINALSPMGGDVLADLACDGSRFYYLDKQHNCQLTGPCNEDTIAQLLHVELAPDDFLYLGTGTPPVIEGSAAMTWDSNAGEEHLTITGPAGTQTIAIDGKNGHHDVLRSELKGPDGKHVWTVTNKDFVDADGHRVPGKTRFETENRDNDLIVDWNKIEENVQLPDGKFQIDLPVGLQQCGGGGGAGATAAPPHP